MDLLQVMQAMNKVYDTDDTLALYFDPDTGKPLRNKVGMFLGFGENNKSWIATPDGGDPLAAFIVAEAREMSVDHFDNVDVDQIVHGLELAQRQLQIVIDALEEWDEPEESE